MGVRGSGTRLVKNFVKCKKWQGAKVTLGKRESRGFNRASGERRRVPRACKGPKAQKAKGSKLAKG